MLVTKPLEEILEQVPQILVIRSLVEAQALAIVQVEDELHGKAFAQLLLGDGGLPLEDLVMLLPQRLCPHSPALPGKRAPVEVEDYIAQDGDVF